MRNGYKITLSMLTIMILLTITVGTSYSYYSITAEQTNPNEVTTTCFEISFNDDNGSSTIALNSDGKYAYPMSESTALLKLAPYEFTVTNTCTALNATTPVNYVVTLNTLTDTTSNLTGYLKYKLNTTAPEVVNGTSAYLNSNVYDLNPNIKTDEGIDVSYSLATGTLSPGDSKTFNLYLWIDESAENDVMGLNFTGKVLVYSYM